MKPQYNWIIVYNWVISIIHSIIVYIYIHHMCNSYNISITYLHLGLVGVDRCSGFSIPAIKLGLTRYDSTSPLDHFDGLGDYLSGLVVYFMSFSQPPNMGIFIPHIHYTPLYPIAMHEQPTN